MKIALTFDVEKDLHSETYLSIKEGMNNLLLFFDEENIRATFFVPATLLEKFPNYFKNLNKKGHEIAIHGYEHERFDELSKKEKNSRIKKSIEIYKKVLKKNPKGFRAPQHSIDKETLKILKQHNFFYDSSYTPFNIFQIIFFPKKLFFESRNFFTPRNKYEIEKIKEIPISSFLIPFVSLPLRIFPWQVLKIYLIVLQITNKDLVFYAHSWDFIKLKKSKIDQTFPHEKFIKNLEKTIKHFKNKKIKFIKLEDL